MLTTNDYHVAYRVWRRRCYRLRCACVQRLPIPRAITDPVTGDHLTVGEHVSWLIQGLIRRWTFLIVLTVATAVIWLTRDPGALLWWNLCASYLAIFIESVVGLAMFSQTKRDAVVMREIRAIDRRVEAIAAALLTDVETIEHELETVEAHPHD